MDIEMQDGTQVQFKSVTLQKYVCAESGGGMDISVDRDDASSWETFTVRSETILLVFISQFDLVLYIKLGLD